MVDVAWKVNELGCLESYVQQGDSKHIGCGIERGNAGWGQRRDVIIADGSGRARVSAWEGHVNMMEEKNHYYLKNFMII